MKKLFFILFLLICTIIVAQPMIKPFPVTPYMISHGEIDTTKYKSEYTGLTTVGVGDLVYLMSTVEGTAYNWSIVSAPEGSAANLVDPDTELMTFRPDLVGDYVIELDVDGAKEQITIVASTYMGFTGGNCGVCHSGTADEWEGTGHSTILIRGLNGTLSDHYTESCIACHTVGYNTDPEADNGGFDDVAALVGWTFPEHPQEGEWEAMNPDLQNVSNVQCENCHGPASQHTSTFNPAKMAISLDSQMCGKCHDDGHYHRRPLMWSRSGHAMSESISGATRDGCNDCHAGSKFIELVDQTPGIQYDPENPGAIGCAVCHDPHSSHDNHDPMVTGDPDNIQAHHLRKIAGVELTNGEVVTIGGVGKLCINCHKGRRVAEEYVDDSDVSSHFGPHHSTQGDMILGTNAITFGRYIPSSTHKDVLPDLCVSCHMSETPGGRSGFGEYGRDYIGDHTFNMHWVGDDGIADTEDDVYNVGICQSCHGEHITSFDEFPSRADHDGDGTIETAREELHGLLEQVEMLLPPVGSPEIDFNLPFNAVQRRALFNHAYVEEDYSMGMHNYQFATGLLKVTIEALNYGVLTKGEIMSITDVPNDQGKQVYITWTRFGGDGASNDPVTDYVILRKDQMSLAKTTYPNKASVSANFKIGDTIMDEGEVWVIAATTRAIQFFEYTIVAPTVYDGQETAFKVVGVTSQGLSAETDEVMGISEDNLAPAPPTGFVGSYANGKVQLSWEEAVDEDFQYFAVYKSQTQGFVPSEENLLATTIDLSYVDEAVSAGNSYYYRVSAFDFAGNQGEASEEVPIVITNVVDLSGVPTEYTLLQNYPNPFNPTTEITFGLPKQSEVKLTVYNAVGKEVAVIVNQQLSAGYHKYTFSASNLATGVYFYEIKSDNFRSVKKMLLVK